MISMQEGDKRTQDFDGLDSDFQEKLFNLKKAFARIAKDGWARTSVIKTDSYTCNRLNLTQEQLAAALSEIRVGKIIEIVKRPVESGAKHYVNSFDESRYLAFACYALARFHIYQGVEEPEPQFIALLAKQSLKDHPLRQFICIPESNNLRNEGLFKDPGLTQADLVKLATYDKSEIEELYRRFQGKPDSVDLRREEIPKPVAQAVMFIFYANSKNLKAFDPELSPLYGFQLHNACHIVLDYFKVWEKQGICNLAKVYQAISSIVKEDPKSFIRKTVDKKEEK
jgi:hypothetical protein